MEQLTHEQIETVINWMNGWEQLKDTAIPIRFKADFENQIKHVKRPPIGICPKWIWEEDRKAELLAAMVRYSNENIKIPSAWAAEFLELCDK
jgi:hypothetical protein